MVKVRCLLILLLCLFTGYSVSEASFFSSGGGSSVSDDAYGAGWNGDTTTAASKNALYDKIESLAGGHAAVTLGADADILLGLSTQEIQFDTQTKNTVLAGPTTGVDADPTFRALVADDIPDISGTYQTVLTNEAGLYGALSDVTDFCQPGDTCHDGFSDFVANEHIDWTQDQGATNIHSGNYTDNDTTYVAGDFNHDDLANIPANDHIDWTVSQAPTVVHADNYTDTNTTYAATGTLLDLTGTNFSLNEGTLTTTKGCKYVSGTGLVCDQDYLTSESDPNALLTAGTDNVKDTHIDWGSGASQVDLDDVPDSATYAKLTVIKDGYIDQDVGSGSSPTLDGTNFSGIPASALPDAAADGATKGVATFNSTRFSAAAGVIDIDSVSGITGADEDDVTAADVGTVSANLDDADASIEWEDATDLESDGSVTWGNLGAGELANDSVQAADIDTINAGRSMTWDTTNDEMDADAETYVFSGGVYFENPTADDDFKSIDWVDTAATITNVWCESDQTVNIDLQVDDGTAADVIGTDIVCDSTPGDACASGCDQTISGDATMASGDRLDLAVTSVSDTPTWVAIHWEGTYDD